MSDYLSHEQIHTLSDKISDRREEVIADYNSAVKRNRRRFNEGDDSATSDYIFPNQMEDANNILNMFYKHNRRVISIQKKTKVGADGLMIEIAKLLTTHNDDNFVVNHSNVRIITGMSNAGWEKDMIDKAPNCFKDKIFHHGKLLKADLMNIKNGLIIIDEIDSGDKELQVLHTTLKDAGVLDVTHMKENNNRFVFISATMIKELYDLYRWGLLHELYKMTIPRSYIGHKDFLEKGILKQFYPLQEHTYACCYTDQCNFETYDLGELKKHIKDAHKLEGTLLKRQTDLCDSKKISNAEKWVQEDILDNYATDFRVHIVRVNPKTVDMVQNACIRKGVAFRNHTSTDRLTEDEIKEFFKQPLPQHIVLGVKGFFRRANLIPNRWKLRIGATHELYTKIVDNSVQIQGLVGRMTGYWRDIIDKGHKTGPYRTSIKAIEEYEKTYNDPFGLNSYQTAGFKKKNGNVSAQPTMLSSQHIQNLEAVDLPLVRQKGSTSIITIEITDAEKSKFDEKNTILEIIRKYNQEAYDKYKSYKLQCWRLDTPSKCEKWGLTAMTKQNAYSSETNITEKTKNVMMIYLHENMLIINAWNGEETI
jgi:hypothetical protein